MTTETEMQKQIESILWMSGDVFVGNITEIDHPGLVVKTLDDSEFQVVIIKKR